LDHKAEELDFDDRTGHAPSNQQRNGNWPRPLYNEASGTGTATSIKHSNSTTPIPPKTGLSAGLIALIVILALAVVAAIIGLVLGCSKKKDDTVEVTPVPITEPRAVVATAAPGTDTPAN